MSGPFGSTPHNLFKTSDSFYPFEVQNALRFNGTGSLTFTPGESNTGDWTFSTWIKRTKLSGNYSTVFSCNNYASTYSTDVYGFGSANKFLRVGGSNANSFASSLGDSEVRDTSAWYHFCYRNSNTEVTVWINGRQTIQFTPGGTVGQRVGQNSIHDIGAYGGSSRYYNNDFILAETYWIHDGSFGTDDVYDYTKFAEFKDGVLVPKENELSTAEFGDNGFYLEYKQSGTSANSSGIGADTSGNGNHLGLQGSFADGDKQYKDTPTNNWCNLNDKEKNLQNQTYSDGNLKYSSSQTSTNPAYTGTFAMTAEQGGKWYWESYIKAQGNTSNNVGIVDVDMNLEDDNTAAYQATSGMYAYEAAGDARLENGDTSYGDSWTTGDIIGVALDMDDGAVYFYKNNTIQNSGTALKTGLKTIGSGKYTPYGLVYASGAQNLNFGQDPTFQGEKTSGSADAADGNGQGSFYYTPPDGYNALCNANLPNVAVGAGRPTIPSEAHNVTLHTGDGTSSNAITGTGHKPDLLWIKPRNDGDNNCLFNTTLGGQLGQYSNSTSAEFDRTATSNDGVAAFGTNGYTLGTWNNINESTINYVAWTWAANGGTTTAFTESGDNPGGTYQANTTTGFSVVTYTGTGATGTVQHGLGAIPAFILIKNRDQADDWATYHHKAAATSRGVSADPETDYFVLNSTSNVQDSANWWADTAQTSSVFTVATDHSVNADGEKYVAYVWAEVEGYRRFGTYRGNGNSDGPFTYCGFRPATWMAKSLGTENWIVNDNQRPGYNKSGIYIYWNLTNSEGGSGSEYVDLYASGVKIRTTGASANSDNTQYIFAAWADQSFKFANAF